MSNKAGRLWCLLFCRQATDKQNIKACAGDSDCYLGPNVTTLVTKMGSDRGLRTMQVFFILMLEEHANQFYVRHRLLRAAKLQAGVVCFQLLLQRSVFWWS